MLPPRAMHSKKNVDADTPVSVFTGAPDPRETAPSTVNASRRIGVGVTSGEMSGATSGATGASGVGGASGEMSGGGATDGAMGSAMSGGGATDGAMGGAMGGAPQHN